MDDRALHELAQGIRRAHCSRTDDAQHTCVGQCTITPNGVELSCHLCGDQDEPIADVESAAGRAVRALLDRIGLEFESLSGETQRAAIDEMTQILQDLRPTFTFGGKRK